MNRNRAAVRWLIVGNRHSVFFGRVVFADRGRHLGAHRAASVAGLRAAHLSRARLFLDARLLGLER